MSVDTAQADIATTPRPPEPVRASRPILIVLGATPVAAAIGVTWPSTLVWGVLLGAVAFAALWLGDVTRRLIHGVVIVVAGGVSAQIFTAIFDARTSTISWPLSLRSSLGWMVFGLAVGVVVFWAGKLRSPTPILWIGIAAGSAGFFAMQVGTVIGYVGRLRAQAIAAGEIQQVTTSFFVWTGAIVIVTLLAVTFSYVIDNAAVVAVAFCVTMTVVAFNQIEFSIFEIFRRFGNLGDLAQEFWPPRWTWPKSLGQEPSLVIVEPFIETLQIAVVGATVGCTLALPLAFLASRPTAPSDRWYWGAKMFMNVIRTIPDLFWGIMFAIAVGFGTPFAGALAMVMFSLAIMAKLLSETVDAIDPGPLEAADAAGANHWAMVRYAAYPQVSPNYVAYALYIFELNIRASVVIGIVGAGGIGRLLDERRNLFQWDEVMAIVIVIFVAVILIEILSIQVRRRLV